MSDAATESRQLPGPRQLVRRSLNLLPKMALHPRRTTRELLAQKTVYLSLVVVLGFAVLESLLFLVSYLAGDYPPPPEELRIWIETWGEFAMLPFVNIPPESYRLAMAIFMGRT